MNTKKPAPYFLGKGARPKHERAPVISSLEKAASNCLIGEGRREGGPWDLESELVHSLINLFSEYLPSTPLGTECTLVTTTHGPVFRSLLGR